MAADSSNANSHVSQETLCSLFRYEPETGKLFWRERPISMFPDKRTRILWNAKLAGKEAFTSRTLGYPQGKIFGKTHYAHRVIWTMIHGDAKGHIDHINGIRIDNRLSNLRLVDQKDNCRNSALRSDNASGHPGISRIPSTGMWRVRIKNTHVGCFKTFDEAISARKEAEKQNGFHPNHGRNATYHPERIET